MTAALRLERLLIRAFKKQPVTHCVGGWLNMISVTAGAVPSAALKSAIGWAETFPEEIEGLLENRTLSDDLAPWRPAVVLSASDAAAQIGFADGSEGLIPLEQMTWAREYISANDRADALTAVSAVLSPGDVIYVEQGYQLPELDENGNAIINADEEPILLEGVYALRQVPAVNGGLIAIDPHTGRVLAMVGGFSFQLSEFNRAVQALRQPGSTFKPFVYSVALDSGYTPSSTVLDAPFVAPGVDSWYKPGNYIEGRFYGESTLRLGIEQSRNTMTARLAQDLGIGRIRIMWSVSNFPTICRANWRFPSALAKQH